MNNVLAVSSFFYRGTRQFKSFAISSQTIFFFNALYFNCFEGAWLKYIRIKYKYLASNTFKCSKKTDLTFL